MGSLRHVAGQARRRATTVDYPMTENSCCMAVAHCGRLRPRLPRALSPLHIVIRKHGSNTAEKCR